MSETAPFGGQPYAGQPPHPAQPPTFLAPVVPPSTVAGTVTVTGPPHPADDRTPAEHPRGQPADAEAPQEPPAAPPVPQGPVPFLRGDFALYATPDNALVLAYRPDGTPEDRQLVVPAFILDMAARQSGQTTAQLISRLKEGI